MDKIETLPHISFDYLACCFRDGSRRRD